MYKRQDEGDPRLLERLRAVVEHADHARALEDVDQHAVVAALEKPVGDARNEVVFVVRQRQQDRVDLVAVIDDVLDGVVAGTGLFGRDHPPVLAVLFDPLTVRGGRAAVRRDVAGIAVDVALRRRQQFVDVEAVEVDRGAVAIAGRDRRESLLVLAHFERSSSDTAGAEYRKRRFLHECVLVGSLVVSRRSVPRP
ncbi:hypothetical protein C491_16492 [Natronococcus amylolyticus DSM 10524]|uniref:Uncharacterized protein n=1 Tax=Natronococcus amylolyticus DSM 10524 TaxID=1227497 RepID=L9X140_9EURY|nr:hypothetical protein C491_16492 [Natronococcus amylolyticus DSM 10524]